MSARSLRARSRWLVLGLVLLAWLPSLGTLDAPWIAEDAAILGRVEADGAWADWSRPQYGLQRIRFWRPVVSAVWSAQEAWTGIAPAPLRALNLGLHALVAVLVFGCVRRLGSGLVGAAIAGAWIALFPEQGGTSTWIAGRTDLLAAAFLLGSVFTALGPTPLLAAPLVFLACASKEFGFLAPLWLVCLAWGRGETWSEIVRRGWPMAATTALAFLWRRLALGSLVGGYPLALPGLGAGLAGSLRAGFEVAWPSGAGLALLALGAARRGACDRRAFPAAIGCALLGAGLLVPLLSDGHLEAENRRLFYVAECGLALAAGVTWCRTVDSRAAIERNALLVLALLPRLVLAWQDTHDWARSAEQGERVVQQVRAAVRTAEVSERPVFGADFPTSLQGAYCLGFGLSARFRAPFPDSPRPVWPWRLVFVHQPARERAPLVAPRAAGTFWPLDDGLAAVAPLLVTHTGSSVARVELDERAFQAEVDDSTRLTLAAGPPGARLEALLVTELGYEPFPLEPLDGRGTGSLTMMQLLARGNGVAVVAEALLQAADMGATHAWLELRALGSGGEVRAAAPWIRIDWSPELLARALSAR